MNPTTLTQQMGAQPVAARRRAVVCVAPYATTRFSNVPAHVSLVSGFCVGGDMGHIPTRKRPTRHLVARMT